MSHYYSEEIYDLEMEIIKLKRENDELRKQLKEKEARIIELEQVKSEAKWMQDNYLFALFFKRLLTNPKTYVKFIISFKGKDIE